MSSGTTSYVPSNFSTLELTTHILPDYSPTITFPSSEKTSDISKSYTTEGVTSENVPSTIDSSIQTSLTTDWTTQQTNEITHISEQTESESESTSSLITTDSSSIEMSTSPRPELTSDNIVWTGQPTHTDHSTETQEYTSEIPLVTLTEKSTKESSEPEKYSPTTDYPTSYFPPKSSSEILTQPPANITDSIILTTELAWTTENVITEFITDIKISSSTESYTDSTTEVFACSQYSCANGGTCYEEKNGLKVVPCFNFIIYVKQLL